MDGTRNRGSNRGERAQPTSHTVATQAAFLGSLGVIGTTSTPLLLLVIKVHVRSTQELGPVTIELLDHHRQPFASHTVRVGLVDKTFLFANKDMRKGSSIDGIEGFTSALGSFDLVQPIDLGPGGPGVYLQLGSMKTPDP